MSASVHLPVADLLKAGGGSASLVRRVHEADADGDGELSRDEVLQVFASELRARRSKKRLTWALVAAGIACVLLLAANAGLTYAVVALSKDTSLNNGLLVAKDSGEVIKTGTALLATDADSLLWLNPANMSNLHSVTLPLPDGGVAWHQVVGASAWPGNRTVLYTAAGWRVLIAEGQLLLEGPAGTPADEETSVALASAAGGRRLLEGEEQMVPPEEVVAPPAPRKWPAHCPRSYGSKAPECRALFATMYPDGTVLPELTPGVRKGG